MSYCLTVVILVEGTLRTTVNEASPFCFGRKYRLCALESRDNRCRCKIKGSSSGVRLPQDMVLSLVSIQLTDAGLAVFRRLKSRNGPSHPSKAQAATGSPDAREAHQTRPDSSVWSRIKQKQLLKHETLDLTSKDPNLSEQLQDLNVSTAQQLLLDFPMWQQQQFLERSGHGLCETHTKHSTTVPASCQSLQLNNPSL